MALGNDLKSEVSKILKDSWSERAGRVVPESEHVKLGNDAVTLEATVLYADLDESTRLADNYKPQFAAKIYKSFLATAARIIRSEGGSITSFDGDRIMAVFIGQSKNTVAARAALKVNYVAKKIINPAIKSQYPRTDFQIKHVVGVDTSALFVARTGIRGANDLVWVGRAANYAAKLSSRSGPATQITADVFNLLKKSSKIGSDGRNMWQYSQAWQIHGKQIYGSDWTWSV